MAMTCPLVAVGQATESSPGYVLRMNEAAKAFVASLGPEESKKALFDFDDEVERKHWSNVPVAAQPRNGLGIGDMNDAQKIAAHRLIDSALSSQGYAKVSGLIQLDDICRDLMEQSHPGAGIYFGSDKFLLAVFGKPGGDAPWGWQLDGHHLAVNTTVVGDQVSSTPIFFGAEPDVVPRGPYAGLQILGAERQKALAVIRSLTADQRSKAVLSDSIPSDIFEGPGRAKSLKEYEGITAAKMSSDQRALLWVLIDEYLNNCTEEVASARRAKIQADGDAALYFAWMGPTTEDGNLYYRVHGPSIIIEYDNTSVGESPEVYSNHLHTILREPSNDYGEDLLRRHYEESDHHQH
jgi:hypothetical protein